MSINDTETNSNLKSKVKTTAMFASRFNNDYKMAQNFIECLKFIQQEYDNFPMEDVWTKMDDKSIDERETHIKKKKKRERKKDDSFSPEDIKKPKRLEIARDDYRSVMKEKGENYSNERFVKWYAALSDKKKLVHEAKYQKDLKVYEMEYEKQLKTAIENGDFPEPKPKQPVSGYFLFISECRKMNPKFVTKKDLAGSEKMKEIERTQKVFGPLWNKFKSNEKEYKVLMEVVDNLRTVYKRDLYERNVRVLERLIAKGEREGTDVEGFKEELEDVKREEPDKVNKSKLKLSL